MLIKLTECCTCGYKWRTGQDGHHSCSTQLHKEVEKLKLIDDYRKQEMKTAEKVYELDLTLLTAQRDLLKAKVKRLEEDNKRLVQRKE